MVQVKIMVREVDSAKPDFSVLFELPEVPRVGSYISINRPDHKEPFGEDLIVKHVWWRLHHPTTGGVEMGVRQLGEVREIVVECDPAVGPWASDAWRRQYEGRVEEFDVERLRVPESLVGKP